MAKLYDQRYVVRAERHDGSTIADTDLTFQEVLALIATALIEAKRVECWVDDGSIVEENRPVLDDVLTEMFRAKKR